ncbi:hypothetical protein VCHENC02_1180B, partial [Vibrio harveyi]
SL